MSREIKFRSWLILENKMLNKFGIVYNDEPSETSRRILMQYTGLKDKNGVEIYEGDIVDYGAFDLSVIKYERGTFWARLGQYPMHVIGEYEVKGNIYEHHHLLEVQQ